MVKNKGDTKEDRDQQILRRLANIEHRVDSIDQTQAFALRADATRHFGSVSLVFGKRLRRAQVYLAANGERSVDSIAKLLNMKQPNVSRELTFLQNEGLLEISESDRGETYYCKKPIDRTIRISSYLQKEYSLNKDGLPNNKN
jgi:DNA-binding transcriptional ArsR family regulator